MAALFRVDVSPAPGIADARGGDLCRQAETLGIGPVATIRVSDIYFLAGELEEADVTNLVSALLYDPVVEEARWHRPGGAGAGLTLGNSAWAVEVAPLPGVTDSVAESLLEGARIAGIGGLEAAATGRRYAVAGDLSETAIRVLAEGLLANTVIQSYSLNAPVAPPFITARPVDDTVEVISLTGADSSTLETISRERRLSLDLPEMQAIREYYRTEGREPTDVELEMLAQTWSEHCVHKTFKALIDYQELSPEGDPVPGSAHQVDSLLKTCIRAATEEVNKPWVHSAFVDNAGVIAFDDSYDLAFKVETHNHPSALEPFGGANTGVGGVIRDVIGVSARPIANTDVLCFGPPDLPHHALPAGVLHPRRIAAGVTAGVEDYGNKMGIPTVNGAILYAPGYTANPLVFCGCLGLLPRGAHPSKPRPGDLLVVIGGRTGRDGLRGATFSSMEMDHETGTVAGSAVQIGHPIHEKQALEAVMQARDEGLYTAITDCGAGGLSSAVGEMAAKLGAEVHLDRVPLKYSGLRPWEIWLSEAQERMVLAVGQDRWPRLQLVCQELDVEATVLGCFTDNGRLTLWHRSSVVGEISTAFLHGGIPRRHLRAVWQRPLPASPAGAPTKPAGLVALLSLLATPDIRSKEDVVRRYDHEVQGATIVKPFMGLQATSPSDAAVLDLRFTVAHAAALAPGPSAQAAGLEDPSRSSRTKRSVRGVAVACGINPAYGEIDPYVMAWAAVDEAIRNCVAVGADPDRVALLDNFCWGNPLLPDRLGGLVRCAEGCHDAALAYEAPFISGKDSLNNEYTTPDGGRHAIPGTLLVSALAIVPDTSRTVTADLKAADHLLYAIGETRDELAGSAYWRLSGVPGVRSQPPQPPAGALASYRALHRAILAGLVQSCHDCSEGGLAVAAAEMALGGDLGLELRLGDVPGAGSLAQNETIAFSESLGRMLVAVRPEDAARFEQALSGLPCALVGRARAGGRFVLIGREGLTAFECHVGALQAAWRGHLWH